MTIEPSIEMLETGRSRRPLYQRLIAAMRQRIESGQLRPGEKAPSESDLIAEFRVSSTTARRCLDELERLQLVRRVQGKGTFVTSRAMLTEHRQIGILYNELFSLGEGISAHIFRGAGQILDSSPYQGVLLAAGTIGRTGEPSAALRELVKRNKLEGLLIMSPLPASWLTQVLDDGLPVASINFAYEDSRICSAIADGHVLMQRLAGRLLKAGHRQATSIRGIFPPELLEGVKLGSWDLSDARDLDCRIETFPYFGPDRTQEVVDRCLAENPRSTAFIAVGYEKALRVRHAVKAWNLSIPEDVSLLFVGAPPGPSEISGEVIPIEAMSAWAVRAILDMAEGRVPQERTRIFPTRPLAGVTCRQGLE